MPISFTDPVNKELDRLGLTDVSVRLISGRHVWDELEGLLEPHKSELSVAIAYIGSAAADWLPLAKGSSLITNAGLDAVRAGSTDPNVLLKWARAGIHVYSLSTLHAKLVLAGGKAPFAVVGSANASASSAEVLNEAVVISDERHVIDDANAMIAIWKAQATPLTVSTITSLLPEFKPPLRKPRLPSPRRASWPKPAEIHIVRTVSETDFSEEAIETFERLRAEYSIGVDTDVARVELDFDMFSQEYAPGSGPSDNPQYPVGDHVVTIDADRAGRVRGTSRVNEPARVVHTYVDSGAEPARAYYYVMFKVSAMKRTLAEVRQALAEVGEEFDEDRHYQRRRPVDAIVGLWTDINYEA